VCARLSLLSQRPGQLSLRVPTQTARCCHRFRLSYLPWYLPL